MKNKTMDKKFSKTINFLLIIAIVLAAGIWLNALNQVEANNFLTYQARMDFLDVGQADSALINLPNSKQILIDTGENSNTVEKVKQKMPATDRKIEHLILTHPDSDHIGGSIEVVQSYQIGEILTTKKESKSQIYKKLKDEVVKRKIKLTEVNAGDEYNIEGAWLKILYPVEDDVNSMTNNESSIVFNFDYKGAKALFMGDSELTSQGKILKITNDTDLVAQIIKIPHHGSADSLNKNFLQKVQANFAVISVGKNNKYGLPSSLCIEALNKMGIKIFRTDEEGNVSFGTNGLNWQAI